MRNTFALTILLLLAHAAAADVVTVVYDSQSPTGGIQEAFARLGPAGGTIFIPAGRYVMRAPVMLENVRKPITLAGEGAATVLVASDEYQVKVLEAAEGAQHIVKVAEPEKVAVGDYLWIPSSKSKWHSARALIEKVNLETGELTVRRRLSGPVAADVTAYHSHPLIYASQIEHLTVRDMTLIGSLRQESFRGWSSWLANPALMIYGNAGDVRDVTVIDAPSDAISCQAKGPYRVRDCRIINSGGMGIHIGGHATRVDISGNQLERIAQWGIYLCNGSQQVTIADNVVTDVGVYDDATGEVINDRPIAGSGPTNVEGFARFRWNMAIAAIGGLGGGGKGDKYNTITGNVIQRSRGSGISFLRWSTDKDTRPGECFTIANNVITDITYAGVHLYAADAVSVTGNSISRAGEGVAVVKAARCAVQQNLLRECTVGIAVRSMDGWGPVTEPGPPAERNVITNNALFDCATPIQHADDAPDNVVEGNHVSQSPGSAEPGVPAPGSAGTPASAARATAPSASP